MKKSPAILFIALVIALAGFTIWLHADMGESEDVAALKHKAYDLYERGLYERSAEMFQGYVNAKPADAQAAYDYAVLLIRLKRHAEAAGMLETVHRLEPKREAAYFKLGAQCVLLHRNEEAAAVFAELAKSSNPDMAQAAAEAGARLATDLDRVARAKAEQRVYDLASELKYPEVIAAVGELERQREPSLAMAMQRIYAYASLQQYTPALALAEQLAVKYPKATELMLLRAELLLQLGRNTEALRFMEQVARENLGSEVAQATQKRMVEIQAQEAGAGLATPVAEHPANAALATAATSPPPNEAIIYNLAEKRRHREVVVAIDELEQKKGALDWSMKMQRLYALQAVGDLNRACQEAEKMAAEKPDSVELAMLRADLLFRAQKWEQASAVLKNVRDNNPNTPVAKAADRRLADIPAVKNLDKWNWGESYNSGDYHSRYDSVIGYGYLRTGTYVPQARWLQPYLSFNYVVDTKSGGGSRLTIISDNSVGFYGGVRAQLFTKEYLFVYIQGGWNKDLLERRDDGDWASDYMGGIYGYKAWGPGVNWEQPSPGGNSDAAGNSACSLDPIWRGDWWVDAGADFSYYDRFAKWLGYGQVREGVRLAQFGSVVAMDAYVMQNLAWDVEGTYTDNLVELGPGLRFVYVPCRNCQVVLRTEWVEGFYWGRGDQGSTGSTYDDFRVGLSLGVSW